MHFFVFKVLLSEGIFPMFSYVYLFMFTQVMEHPHTILLTKVLEANIALRNAHLIEEEEETRSTQIVRRWMNLQQALNIMFDNKTASSKASNLSIVIVFIIHRSIMFVLHLHLRLGVRAF